MSGEIKRMFSLKLLIFNKAGKKKRKKNYERKKAEMFYSKIKFLLKFDPKESSRTELPVIIKKKNNFKSCVLLNDPALLLQL